MIRTLVTSLLLMLAIAGKAQLIAPAMLDTVWNYESIEEALENPEKVYKLTLRKKRLSEIPEEVFTKFPNLQVLDLSKNKLTSIPPEIKNLKYLQELDVSANMIETIADEFCELQHLRIFRAGRNEISTLPGQVGKLASLEYLDLWSNNIKGLPISISDIPNLEVVDLRVIQMNKDAQDNIKELLPNATIHFSQYCNCD